MSNTDNIFYLNLEKFNNSNVKQQTILDNTFHSDIIKRQSDYNVVVKRLDLDTSRIPIVNLNNVSNLQLRFVNTNDFKEYIKDVKDYFPANTNEIYHIDEILTAFNDCLSDIYLDAGLTTNTLTYRFNYNTYKFTAKITKPSQPTWKHKLYFDDLAYQWFGEGFLNKYNANTNEYEMLYINEWNGNVTSHTNTEGDIILDYITVDQEYPTASNIFEANKIVILSNSLQTNPETLSMSYYATGYAEPLNKGILFDISYQPILGRKQVIYSDANNDTRIINLIGQNSLSSMSISVYYQTKSGKLYPLLIPPNSSFNMKLKFIKKENV